jgi:hypothetical protein
MPVGMTTLRIAMWSGPRNISTALMRSFGNRDDCAVWDEPFYAHYLKATGIDHPGRDEIVAAHESDWRKVSLACAGPAPGGLPVFYQKHMAHHLLPEVGRSWLAAVENCFLIRDPAEVAVSYARARGNPTLADLGYAQQCEVFEATRARAGRIPPVIDARDVLENPRRILRLLCAALGLGFSERMLSWPAGPRASDGVWAKHWYAAVDASMGFQAYAPPRQPPPARLLPLIAEARPYYERLRTHRLV